MQGINQSHKINFNGTYLKRIKNKKEYEKNLSKNPELNKDLQFADRLLFSVSKELDDGDSIELYSNKHQLELIVNKGGRVIKEDIGVQDGLIKRLCNAVSRTCFASEN